MADIWIEKYRPKTFDEVKGQKEIISRIKAFTESKNMPHLLLAGPPGVGKTTTSLVIARELFGNDWHDNFLELNASDERGIDVVRVRVKEFARTKAIGDVPFKIIYLDECDALTREAQQALRRTMENYTNTCRFILSCNYSSKIIDPIQSRCTMFRFKPLAEEDMISIVEMLAKKENVTIEESGKKALWEISQGDVRKAENVMQSCTAVSNTITSRLVYEIASFAEPKKVLNIMKLATQDFITARKELLKLMLEQGLSGLDIIKQFSKEVWNLDVNDETKLEILIACGEAEFRMIEGSDELIQLEALLSKIALKNKNDKKK